MLDRTVSSRIALGEHEPTSRALVRHVVCRIERLHEDVWQLIGVGWRAYAVVNLRLICDMAVVSFVQVLAIPAALKMDLSSHSVDAIRSEHVRSFGKWLCSQAIEAHTVCYRPTWVRRIAPGVCFVVIAPCRLVARKNI